MSQINLQEDTSKEEKETQVESHDLYIESWSCLDTSASDKEDMETAVMTLTIENKQLIDDYKHLIEAHDALKRAHEDVKRTNESLKTENSKFEEQLLSIRKDYDDLRQTKVEGAADDPKPSYGELKLDLIQTKQDLTRAKEILQGMKCDRKRLKGEKLDLLSQIKELYSTLEEKETELRDFIGNYEQHMKENDDMVKQLAKEKEDLESEKWQIITKAKDAAERATFLKAQVDAKERCIKMMEKELQEMKEKVLSEGNIASSNYVETASDGDFSTEEEVFHDDLGFSTMEESSVLNNTFTQEGETILSTSLDNITASVDESGPMFKWFTQSSDLELALDSKPSKKKKKSFGSLSRVFSRGRSRRSIAIPNTDSFVADDIHPKLCVLNQDNYQEKLNTIEKMVGVHMKDWRAHQVLAWLEITLAMPMYAQNCLTNIKSGKVLLGLSDNELSAALGVTNTMHRRKLRLAIEQHRNPNEIKYIKASEMDPTWIAHRFLLDIGLPQYTDVFEHQLCDGHVLNTLTRRDLEKHFSVHRKFHQSSILHAVELLRQTDFNKEKLYHRRNLCDVKDTDLIVWTNDRLIKWTRSIDLGEYTDNLVESGVHGAMMVLEPSFNADTLASVLGISPSKSYIRRHLTSELDIILKPARTALATSGSWEGKCDDASSSDKNKGLKRSQDKFQRGSEDKSWNRSEEDGRSRLGFRGSLGRDFGKEIRGDLKMTLDAKCSEKTISAPTLIQHLSLSSLDKDSGLAAKESCIKHQNKTVVKSV